MFTIFYHRHVQQSPHYSTTDTFSNHHNILPQTRSAITTIFYHRHVQQSPQYSTTDTFSNHHNILPQTRSAITTIFYHRHVQQSSQYSTTDTFSNHHNILPQTRSAITTHKSYSSKYTKNYDNFHKVNVILESERSSECMLGASILPMFFPFSYFILNYSDRVVFSDFPFDIFKLFFNALKIRLSSIITRWFPCTCNHLISYKT